MANVQTQEKVKTNKKADYKPSFEEFVKVPVTSKDAAGNEVGGFRLIPNKIICLPTTENPFHEQGKEYEVGAAAGLEQIQKGLAEFVRTKAENDKLKLEKATK